MRDAESKVFTRRDAVVALAASTATLAGGGCAHPVLAKSPPPTAAPALGSTAPQAGMPAVPSPPVLGGTHAVVPLPFKATGLNGISEKMIVSQWDEVNRRYERALAAAKALRG